MKTTRVMVVFLIFQTACTSQDIQSYGVKAGMSAAKQTWEFESSINHRYGIDVGGYVEWLNLKAISISSEVHYIQKGVTFVHTILSDIDESGLFEGWSPRADYLSFPLLGKVRLGNKGISPYLLAGPRFDFLVHIDEDGAEGSAFSRLTKTDYGVTLGAGLEIHSLACARLGIEFRYSPSFKDVFGAAIPALRNRSMEILLVVSM